MRTTCLLPNKVQLLQWNQEQYTVYPVVVLRKTDTIICKDHFTIISIDAKHNAPFIGLANKNINDQ